MIDMLTSYCRDELQVVFRDEFPEVEHGRAKKLLRSDVVLEALVNHTPPELITSAFAAESRQYVFPDLTQYANMITGRVGRILVQPDRDVISADDFTHWVEDFNSAMEHAVSTGTSLSIIDGTSSGTLVFSYTPRPTGFPRQLYAVRFEDTQHQRPMLAEKILFANFARMLRVDYGDTSVPEVPPRIVGIPTQDSAFAALRAAEFIQGGASQYQVDHNTLANYHLRLLWSFFLSSKDSLRTAMVQKALLEKPLNGAAQTTRLEKLYEKRCHDAAAT